MRCGGQGVFDPGFEVRQKALSCSPLPHRLSRDDLIRVVITDREGILGVHKGAVW